MNHTESGALVGSGIGAVTGAIVGSHSGNSDAGALIGAATGALAGGLIGNAEDARQERDAAVAYANHERQTRLAAQSAMSNSDVTRMANGGVGDSVIIGSIRAQGGRFDLSPTGIIDLKKQGVSDEVIRYMQTNGHAVSQSQYIVSGSPTYAASTPPVYLAPPPVSGAIIVAPRPRTVIIGGHYGVHRGRHRHHRHW